MIKMRDILGAMALSLFGGLIAVAITLLAPEEYRAAVGVLVGMPSGAVCVFFGVWRGWIFKFD